MVSGESVIAVVPNRQELVSIEESLRPEGIEVIAVTNLLEAVLQEASAPATVIIYDSDAPESWRVALEQLLRLHRGARVLFLSRLADDRMWMDVLEGGGYDLLMKPFLAEELRAVVRNAIGRVYHQVA